MFTATDVDSFQSISVKANPKEIEELRARFSCLDTQAYMNKKHWNKVILDNSVEDSIIYKWIDTSYKLVVENLTKKQ
jgi:predicted DNA-binding protein (MmcQ/YjbR family)